MSIEIDTRVAAAVLRQNPKLMRQEFTRVLGRKPPAQSGRRLAFHFRDLLYFRLKASLEETGMALKPEDRQELYALTSSPRLKPGASRAILVMHPTAITPNPKMATALTRPPSRRT